MRIDQAVLLSPDAPRRFAWVLRTNGTHLLWGTLFNVRERLRHIARLYHETNVMHWYWFDGTDLIEYDSAEALIAHVEDTYGYNAQASRATAPAE